MNLIEVCQLTQKQLLDTLPCVLDGIGYDVVEGGEYIYARGGRAVLLVAHLDTVHRRAPRLVAQSERCVMSPDGIGGDDRCGVYMLLEIARQCKGALPSLLFTTDEERGGRGAHRFVSHLPTIGIGEFSYIVEFDRQGESDAVYYDCDNSEFEQFISAHGWATARGSFSDISIIAPALGVAAVNLSAGFYNQHTRAEYIDPVVVENNIVKALELIESECEAFAYIARKVVAKESDVWERDAPLLADGQISLFEAEYLSEQWCAGCPEAGSGCDICYVDEGVEEVMELTTFGT